MNIRAKMTCDSVQNHGDYEQVSLSAVTEGSKENESFSKFTPSANVSIAIGNPNAMGVFSPGKCYYVDFSEVDTPTE